LTSMEERARELGARLSIESAPGTGTSVRLEVGGE
jgi:signal transduction histidine kinase